MIGIIIGLVIMLADAFFIWCCCRVAGIADRAEEEWLEQENIDKTYSFSKSCVKYRKPRTLSEAQREQKRERIKQLNGSITNGEIPS